MRTPVHIPESPTVSVRRRVPKVGSQEPEKALGGY